MGLESVIGLFFELIAAFFGTAAFCVLFHAPVKQYVMCGLTGALGWLVFSLLEPVAGTIYAGFFSSLITVTAARVFAVLRKVPANVFVIAGVFPVIPGTGIYNTIYELMNGSGSAALSNGLAVFKAIAAIVLGIVCAFVIPQKFFARFRKRHS